MENNSKKLGFYSTDNRAIAKNNQKQKFQTRMPQPQQRTFGGANIRTTNSAIGRHDKPNFARKLNNVIESKGLKVIPLGGCGEIGKNMTVFEYGNDIIVVDCGVLFPSNEFLGIDFIIPDTTYLLENAHKIKAMIITHGHEDHIGALRYVLPKICPPIYTAKLTAGMIEAKMEEFSNVRKPQINIVKEGEKIQLGAFNIEFFHQNHSIPDCLGLAINTPVGKVVYATDFKFDYDSPDGKKPPIEKLKQLGDDGVLLLMDDSTNVEVNGSTPSEKVVAQTFEDIFDEAKGRIIITSFASLVNRIQQVIDAAKDHNRKVAFAGRSMLKNVEVATKLGYLKFPKDLVVPIQKVNKLPDDKIAIVCTGSQGQAMSALVRMANGEHKQIKIKKGDTVVVSASPIPGNEGPIFEFVDNLYRRGADVIYGKSVDIHVSGHASKDDLKKIVELVRPQYFIPIHGEYRFLYHHGELAKECGVKSENVIVLENGEIAEFLPNHGRKIEKKAPAGIVMIDGLGVGDVGAIVLRDRQAMAHDGMFVTVLTVDKKTGKVLTSPDIISRGFVYMREQPELIKNTRELIRRVANDAVKRGAPNWNNVRTKLREELSHYLFNQTQRKPLIVPVVIEVDQNSFR